MADFALALNEKLDSVAGALPKELNKERFIQNCIAVLNDKADDFKKYSPQVIMAGLVKGAYLGLDFFQGDCYLIPYGSKLNYQTSYKGEMKLAKKYSTRPIKEIYAKLICEGDEFEEVITNGEQTISFRPKFPHSDKIIGAFAVVTYKDGGMNYDVMTLEELENTRKHSKMKDGNAWKSFTGEMYKKTVIRRLCKYISLDFESVEQQATYTEEAAIETDAKVIADVEIEENANQVDFAEFVGGDDDVS